MKAKALEPIVYRHGNDGLNDLVSDACSLKCDPDGDRTVQSAALDCDINTIVERFHISGGQMPPARNVPQYGDFTGVSDYQTALDQILEANHAFGALPASVRERFGNDPGNLWAFVQDEANLEEARKLGLVKPAEELPPPIRVEVSNPTPPSDTKVSEK